MRGRLAGQKGNSAAAWMHSCDEVTYSDDQAGCAVPEEGAPRAPLPAHARHRRHRTSRGEGLAGGRPAIVEVYPAEALRRWGLPSSGYKRKDGRTKRWELVRELQHEAGWLRLPDEVAACCEADDNALDALVAALVARTAACGLCEAIPDESLALAEREGWIALPRLGSLQQLAEAKPMLV